MPTILSIRFAHFKKAIFFFFVFFGLGIQSVQAELSWDEIKGKHFVVLYTSGKKAVARKMLRRAEDYYRKIGKQVGYTRYSDFWTWDDRVQIILFPDKVSFAQTTGQPLWSVGYAKRDSYVFQSKAIVTYEQEHDFFDGILPHEVSHLILHDFIPSRNLPLWFDEGVAQLQEANKSQIAHQIMKRLVRSGKHIPFQKLMHWDIRREENTDLVKVFYAQSLSVVEFLIKVYGNAAFQKLCRNLRDGDPFEMALRSAYTNKISSIEQFEEKWLKYMSR